MQKYLINRNIGFDFKTNKSKILRLRQSKLEQLYQACIRTKNFGDISKLNINELPDFDLFNFSFPCFIAGTLILTNKGYKKIENIKTGDYVLTHTNTYQKVVRPMINKANHIYKLSTMCSEDLLVTEEHPFYVREKYHVWNNKKRMYNRLFKEPRWVKVKDLSKDYYVGIAINKNSKLPNWNGCEINSTWAKLGHKKQLNNIKTYFSNKDFWWIIGRYIGDGWVKNYIDKKGTNIYDLYICCAKNELQEITNVLDKLNLINNDFKYKYYEDDSTYRVRISNVELARFLQQFGKYAKNKKLTDSIIDLPIILLKSFLEGYMSADGCFTQNINKCSSVSKELIYGIGQCIAKVYNRPYSIYKNKPRTKIHKINGRVITQGESYSLNYKIANCKQDKAFYENGYIWCPINDILKESYNGLVYNMEVENDNSYTVNNIIVHNCTDISVAGKQKGMTDENGGITRSGLYIYGMTVIKNKKPKYIMIENVKNLVGKKFINDFNNIISELNEVGYNVYWKVLNAKNYGIPQNRERVYAICIRKDIDNNTFEFPIEFDNGIRLKDILEKQVDEKYYIAKEKTEKLLSQLKNKNSLLLDMCQAKREGHPREYTDYSPTLSARDYKEPRLINTIGQISNEGSQSGKVYDSNGVFPTICACTHGYAIGNILENKCNQIGELDIKGHDSIKRVYSSDGISPTLTTMEGGNRQPKVLEKTNMGYLEKSIEKILEKNKNLIPEGWDLYNKNPINNGLSKTLSCDCGHLGTAGSMAITDNYRVRKLTPKECWRLMGFEDKDIDKCINIGISDTQLYKQAGNSIVVDVLYYIFRNLINK